MRQKGDFTLVKGISINGTSGSFGEYRQKLFMIFTDHKIPAVTVSDRSVQHTTMSIF